LGAARRGGGGGLEAELHSRRTGLDNNEALWLLLRRRGEDVLPRRRAASRLGDFFGFDLGNSISLPLDESSSSSLSSD